MPAPADPVGDRTSMQTTTIDPIQAAVDGSHSTLQWVAFIATIVVALAVGAALMHLVERHAHRRQVA